MKIRIAVAVGPSGQWNAIGFGNADGLNNADLAMQLAVEPMEEGERRYWVEVEVDVPEIRTIEGQVVP